MMPRRASGARLAETGAEMLDGGATRRALAAGFGFVVIGATCYFAYAALQGDTGLVEQVRLNREKAELQARLEGGK